MNREKRLVTLSILTLAAYAGSLYLEYGTILYPFPLNEAIFFVASLAFFFWNHEKEKMNSYLALFTALFLLLSTQFFWSFFLDDQEMVNLLENGITDWLRVLFFLGLLAWSTQQLLSLPKKNKYVLISICWIAIPTSVFWSEGWLLVALTLLVFGALTVSKVNTSFSWLWLLFSILEGCKLSMLATASV
jgi:hypothetical protein